MNTQATLGASPRLPLRQATPVLQKIWITTVASVTPGVERTVSSTSSGNPASPAVICKVALPASLSTVASSEMLQRLIDGLERDESGNGDAHTEYRNGDSA
jgi:hypothetical protein